MVQFGLLIAFIIIILRTKYANPLKIVETNVNTNVTYLILGLTLQYQWIPKLIYILDLQITQIFKIEKLLCNHTEGCLKYHCGVDWIARNTQVMTVGCLLALPAQNNIRIKVVANYRFNHVYRQFLVNIDIDFCGYMNRETPNVFLATIMPYVSQYSNINHPCPYFDNVTISRMPLNNAFVQNAILPMGQYRIDVDIYDSKLNRSIIYFKLFFLVPQSNNARMDTTMG